tara:strand:+ start:1124 stop:1852 length:729 start_codon:yes stop_codon:yes gene_type:complete
MKLKDYALVVIYFLVLGLFIYTGIQDGKYKDRQFQKINKLNNDLIKLAQYSESKTTDFEYLERKIEDNSQEIEELRRQLNEQRKAAETFYNMFFDTQQQRITEKNNGAETTPPPPNPKAEGVITTLPPSEVSAPPPENISTPIEREQVVVTAPTESVPVPDKVIASCPRPNQNLAKYISNVTLRKNYSFSVFFDVKDQQITNISFSQRLPVKLQKAIGNYLDDFTLSQDKKDCRIPIRLLEG